MSPSHTPGTTPLPLLSATVAIVLLVSACGAGESPPPESVASLVPSESPEPVLKDPSDTEAAVNGAVAFVTEASSYDIHVRRLDEETYQSAPDDLTGAAFGERSGVIRYTSTPEPTLLNVIGVDARDRYIFRLSDDRALLSESSDTPAVEIEAPDPSSTNPNAIWMFSDFDEGARKLDEVARYSSDIAYEGPETLDGTVTTVDFFTERLYGPENGWADDPVPAHRYSGTLSESRYELDPEGSWTKVAADQEAPFTLWLGEDGAPLVLEHQTGGTHERLTYRSFDEPVEIEAPEVGEVPVPVSRN